MNPIGLFLLFSSPVIVEISPLTDNVKQEIPRLCCMKWAAFSAGPQYFARPNCGKS